MTMTASSNEKQTHTPGLRAVCSNRPRPSVQKGPKGNQWWKRDVWHLADTSIATLCGVRCGDWLTITPTPAINSDCCVRCAAIAKATGAAS
ncbi:hypothetical protein [Mesorhizobium sp. BE184]|uniref:hypothetical protein n=1 Tax=Mesorhizobium sp. BE184 TaxID=2817714 RepID=UPI002861A2B5|nr:hypothetical protein [Mesorhizobium sp. BE184]MDR7032401.1 hypothetical protein [Mesorhizobium sp. BE184]